VVGFTALPFWVKNMSNKFFLYIRKSTDEDNRQVLSLEAQEAELKEFAHQESLQVVQTFRESQTAKEPGRPIFNQMLSEIEKGNAEGILAWHPDRLARNSVDGGKIIYLIDTGKIKELKFPSFWFKDTPQGKFMLNIAFGQSKYYVDNLSENVKRGIRQKLRRGEWPGLAPIGYLNELRTHTIVKDPERFILVKKLFEFYAAGDYSLKGLQKLITSAGLLTRRGRPLSIATIQHILENPIYYGVFEYYGELHQGKHQPMITKKLFDKVQAVMKDKARPRIAKLKPVYPFRGLLKCADCGCSITSQTQKGHIYYHCTKKRVPCSQPYVRQKTLVEQIKRIIQKVSLKSVWADKMVAELDNEIKQKSQTDFSFTQNLKSQVEDCKMKLDKLLDAHLDNAISREEYIAKKQKILNQKIEISEKLKDFERKGNHWLERAKMFILASKQAKIIASGESFAEMKNFLKKLGLNRVLDNRAVSIEPRGAWKILYNLPAERLCREAAEKGNSKLPVWRG